MANSRNKMLKKFVNCKIIAPYWTAGVSLYDVFLAGWIMLALLLRNVWVRTQRASVACYKLSWPSSWCSMKAQRDVQKWQNHCTLLCKWHIVAVKETREGWPLLTVETEVNGDSESANESGPSLVGSLVSFCQYKILLPCLGCSGKPTTNNFFLTVHYFSLCVPFRPAT